MKVAQVHCQIVNNGYQQHFRVLYTFIPNKSFGQLLDISPKNVKFLTELSKISKFFILMGSF